MNEQTTPNPTQHGGAREGAGRKARYTTPTQRKVTNLPAEFIKAIEQQHGSIQQALETLALSLEPRLVKLINTNPNPTNQRKDH